MRLPPSRATVALGAVTAATWLLVSLAGLDQAAAFAGGFIPARLSGMDVAGDVLAPVPVWLTPLSATLVHAGLIHIAFNLLMLGFCGRFVEVALGPRGLVLLYLIGAYAAAAAQYLVDPASTIPMVGASGAVSALFGAYALLFGERRGRLASHRFGRAIHVLWLAAAWIGFQLLVGLATLREGGGIAIAAHIGGFLAGIALARPLLMWRYRNA